VNQPAWYRKMPVAVAAARQLLGRPLSYAEKVLYAHIATTSTGQPLTRGVSYADFYPDRVAMQDATAQMALLQFMNAGRDKCSVPASVHCDHLIQAQNGASADLANAVTKNAEIYDFLAAVADRYGIDFWGAGSGIIHQVVLENYAIPGQLMIGTDSHTPNAGGLAMLAVGVGGSDAVDVLAGLPWELKLPKLIGVQLNAKLNGWAAPKDIVLHLTGLLGVAGGTGAIIEYFGEGAATISATGKATICNMGAEMGATASIFPYDEQSARYLQSTGRADVAVAANANIADLQADPEVLANPQHFFDQVITLELDNLEPYVNGPFTPDAAIALSQLAETARTAGYPDTVSVGLLGSCTNSSYEDLGKVAELAAQASAHGVTSQGALIVNPGSQRILLTSERDGIMATLQNLGALIMANACGPCIGQWQRGDATMGVPNTIVTSFNRNFAARNDGNPATHAFVASPEITFALTLAGRLSFNPLRDPLTAADGTPFLLKAPTSASLPAAGFVNTTLDLVRPSTARREIVISADSKRLQRLEPFLAWNGQDIKNALLLMKVSGKCTTDHISAAGSWLQFRGHLGNISQNLLSSAQNAYRSDPGMVLDVLSAELVPVATAARHYQQAGLASVIVAENNYGEGSSREHAAMEPRYLGVQAVLAKSFARIHETNLKKQGVLALTFDNPADYELVREDDQISILGLLTFAPDMPLTLLLNHSDGSCDSCYVRHSYNAVQIAWFQAGSALNAQAMKGVHNV
jgi:aconitate hydratase